jgi:hypothetical protein
MYACSVARVFRVRFLKCIYCGARLDSTRLGYARVKGAGNANLRVGTGVRVTRSWDVASDQGTKSEEGEKIDVGVKFALGQVTPTVRIHRPNREPGLQDGIH